MDGAVAFHTHVPRRQPEAQQLRWDEEDFYYILLRS